MIDFPDIEICSQCNAPAERACLICGTPLCLECYSLDEICENCLRDEEDYFNEVEEKYWPEDEDEFKELRDH